MRQRPQKLPYGEFLGYEIWRRDATPTWLKLCFVALTVLGLAWMLFSSHVLVSMVGMDGSWDEQHGLHPNGVRSYWEFLPTLASVTLGVSPLVIYSIFVVSYGLFGLLILADFFVRETTTASGKKIRTTTTTSPWPSSWEPDNTICYHDMFSEPTRWGRLLRRPGNTLSNVNYLVSSLCVIATCFSPERNLFWMADLGFGTMLFLLCLFSTIWHASNSPWSQYPDIWSMDCCILYLLVRYCCLGVLVALIDHGPVAVEKRRAVSIAGAACFLIFVAIVAGLGRFYWDLYQRRWLHGSCPFSGRARLMGKGDVFGKGQQECSVLTICAFAALPVLYTGLPTIIQLTLMNSIGSFTAGNLAFGTLIIGWTYRLWERWVMDGCTLINIFITPSKPNLFHIIGAAVFSPTAVLHFFTGLTLLTGYMHCRSVEQLL